MSKLHDELAALTDMDTTQLHARWQLLEGSPALALAPPLLRRLLAQHLQERRYGGVPAAVQRELARIDAGEPSVPRATVRKALTTGTRLVREWNGRTPDRAGNRLPPGNQAARPAAPPFRPQHQCLGTTTAPPASLNFDVQTTG